MSLQLTVVPTCLLCRESMDPITELLSQLSGVRRAATLVSGGPSVGAIGSGTASRLQQLQVRSRDWPGGIHVVGCDTSPSWEGAMAF